jgi:uncharacterized protein (DUF2147 family)
MLAALLFIGAAWSDEQPFSPDPTGEWLVAKRVARIKIVDCNSRLWGVVSWEMQPGIDGKNPDPNLRNRPTLGMPILLGMARSKANQWDGQIYNSEDGHTYSANISLVNPDTLSVRGCFLGFLCGGENWSRVVPLPRVVPQTRRSPPLPPPNARKSTASSSPPETVDDICLRVDPARLPHERGLK